MQENGKRKEGAQFLNLADIGVGWQQRKQHMDRLGCVLKTNQQSSLIGWMGEFKEREEAGLAPRYRAQTNGYMGVS